MSILKASTFYLFESTQSVRPIYFNAQKHDFHFSSYV